MERLQRAHTEDELPTPTRSAFTSHRHHGQRGRLYHLRLGPAALAQGAGQAG